MQRYLAHLGAGMLQERGSVEERLRAIAATLSGDELAIFGGFYSAEVSEFEHDFPRLLYSGFLVSCYSFVELSLLRVCEEYRLRLKVSALDRDNPDKGIFRARHFLKLAGSCELPNDLWQELTFINSIRNTISHEWGAIPTFFAPEESEEGNLTPIQDSDGLTYFIQIEPNLLKYLQRHRLLTFQPPTFLVSPTFEFCQHFIDLSWTLFHYIYDSLEKTHRRRP